jgi:hypothetical protein
MPKKLLLTSCVLVFLLFSGHAQDKKDTVKVLFVGNSYTYYNNLAQMIGLITDSLDTKIFCRKSTAGGATLGEHWTGAKNLRSRQVIQKGKFDIVVIQDNSMWPIQHPDSVAYYGKLFCGLVSDAGAKPYLYNTWARKKTPDTQPQINSVYENVGIANNATVVPVGNCWAKAISLNPSIELYHTDGSHPSPLGTFLVALSFVKKITGKLPTRLPTVYNYLDKDGETFRIMQVSEEEIQFCLRVVNEVIPG